MEITAEVAAGRNSAYKSLLCPEIHNVMTRYGFELINYDVEILPIHPITGRSAHYEGRRYYHYKCTTEQMTGKKQLKFFSVIQEDLHAEVNKRCAVNFSTPKKVSFVEDGVDVA